MNCPELFKASLLMDGELAEDEEARLRTHFGDCPQCRQAWEDFGALRREMRAVETQAAQNADQVLARILAPPPQAGFWHRRIAVPAPLAAAAVLLLAVLALWAGALQWGPTPPPAAVPSNLVAEGPTPERGIDLARFDHGGRTLIYKRPKPEHPLR